VNRDIIVFTLHKCASMFIHKQSELLSKLSGISYHSPNIPNSGLEPRKLFMDTDIWSTRSGCFAPIRFYVDVPHMEDYSIILHLRDPRDMLVSMFYSYCYIHNGDIQANTGHRKEAAEKGIDAFVLTKASDQSLLYHGNYGTGGHMENFIGNTPKRYRDYITNLLGRPNVIFVKYEEMVTDYSSWLEKFITPFPIENKEKVIYNLVSQSKNLFPKRTKDEMAHVRHVTPGDHKLKLQSATIAQLNDIFSDVLDALEYEK